MLSFVNRSQRSCHHLPLDIGKLSQLVWPVRHFFKERRRSSFADAARKQEGSFKNKKPSDEWIEVQRKILRNRFIGNTGKAMTEPGAKFKVADFRYLLLSES